MKKLYKRSIAFILVLCMLSSVNLWIFANSDPPTYTYTNTDAATLKSVLNEYISTEQESDVFYEQSCKLSTGEQGFCHIGYDSAAKAFYIQFIDSTINPSFSWSYKYDTDYAWKYKTNHSSDTNWIEVDSFGIEFIGRTYNYGNPFNLESLDERCQSLFKTNDGSYLSTVNYTYKIRSGNELDCFLDEGVEGDIIYAYAKFDFESEPFYCKISSSGSYIFIDRFVNGQFESYYKYSKGIDEWCNVIDDSTVDKIYLRLNYIRSVKNADALNRILKCLNKPYYPVNDNRLNFTRVDTYLGGKTYYNIYSGYIELSTGEIGLGVIGWSLQTGCFYIQMQTNNPDGKWSYKFTEFDGTPKWKYRDITSDDDFADIDQFYIKFYDRSTGQYIECPSKLSFMFSDGDILDSDTRFLEDGVYKIKNIYNELYLDVTDGGATSGTPVQQWSGTSTDNNINQLFKIAYIDTLQGLDYYSVRPMTNSGLGLYSSVSYTPSAVSVQNMTYIDDTSIPYSQCWAINKSGNIYTIKNGMADVNSYLSAPLNSTNGSQITTSDSISANSQWRFEAYTGDDLDAVVATSISYDLICGETFDYDVYMYSSKIHINGPVRYSVSNIDGSATDKATIDPLTGELRALKSGQIRLEARYTDSPYCYWYWIVTIQESMEGTYWFKNAQYGNYMQIDNNASLYDDGAILELFDFDSDEDQRWNIEYVVNGYYKIVSDASGKAITAPSNLNNALTQSNYIGLTTQQWKISSTENGTYKISPRSSETNYMAAGDGIIFTDGRNVELRVDQSDNKDEWYIRPITYAYSIGGEFYNGADVIDAADTWKKCGYISNYDINPSVSTLNINVLDSSVVYFSSHGTQHSLELFNNIILSDRTIAASANTIGINNFELQNAKLYIYDACLTASNTDGTGINLCTETIASGVDCVIGWKELIGITDARNWQRRFQSRLLAGDSVIDAANYANTFSYIENETIKAWTIYGNQNLIVNEETAIQNVSTISIANDSKMLISNIEFSEYNDNKLKAILSNTFDTYSDNNSICTVTYTNEERTDYVIDYTYTYNGFPTNSGYSIVVQDGYITYMRDNTVTTNVYNRSVAPEITSEIVENAKYQAILEVSSINSNYTVTKQIGSKYYDIEAGIYYYKVKTVYITPENAYGTIITFYEI